MISKFELRIVGDGVEIVVAVDQAGQTLLDDVEERVERRECRVLGIDHDLLLGCSSGEPRSRRSRPWGSAARETCGAGAKTDPRTDERRGCPLFAGSGRYASRSSRASPSQK